VPDPLHLVALSLAHSFASVAGELVPLSGSGAVTCAAVLFPRVDEVADFPELRGLLGAERPAWHLHFDQRDVATRPVAGDRWTDADGRTFQLKNIQQDPLGMRWLCTGFLVVVEDEDDADLDAFMPPVYFTGPTELGL
jgi:hypothetical protein